MTLSLASAPVRADGPPQPTSFRTLPLAPDSFDIDFSMPDTSGRLRSIADFRGQVVILFFGYLSCPSYCPSTLAELSELRKRMGSQGSRVQVVFVTLDPERDDSASLGSYLAHFDRDYVGLRGDADAVAKMARRFRLSFARVPGRMAGSYTIDHGVQSYVFDPQGRLRLLFRPGKSAADMMADLRALLAGG